MKIIRKLCLATAGALVLAAALLVPVAGASEAQPEITDVKGDAISGKDSRDLTAAFFHTETNDTFMINMTVTSLESYTTPTDIPNAPTTEYEVYFSVAQSNYAVACKVPVHGPLGFTIQFDIRTVENNGTTETQLATLSGCRYDVNNHNLQWSVSKTHFTNLTAGARLTKTYAAVYNRNFGDQTRKLEDRGPNSGYGKDYIIRGATGAEILDVKLAAENLTMTCAPNDPAEFRVNVTNAGTSQVNVDLFNGSAPKGWTVVLSLDNMTILPNVTRTLIVTVTPPRTAANRTTATVSVFGKARGGNNQTLNTNTVYLTSTVYFIPPKPVEDAIWVKALKFFTKPTMWTWIVVGLILAAVFGGAGYAGYSRMKRRREEAPEPPLPAPQPAK